MKDQDIQNEGAQSENNGGEDAKSEKVNRLVEQIDQMDQGDSPEPGATRKLPPIHQWNPPLTGDIDMVIKSDGQWFYGGTPITRQKMVELFSTILRREDDGCYYLVTPVEKVRINVEDAAFVVVEAQIRDSGFDAGPIISLRTNVGDWVEVSSAHPIRVEENPVSGEPRPYVHVRDNLEALISRSVYYQLVAEATEKQIGSKTYVGVLSGGDFFPLGAL